MSGLKLHRHKSENARNERFSTNQNGTNASLLASLMDRRVMALSHYAVKPFTLVTEQLITMMPQFERTQVLHRLKHSEEEGEKEGEGVRKKEKKKALIVQNTPRICTL